MVKIEECIKCLLAEVHIFFKNTYPLKIVRLLFSAFPLHVDPSFGPSLSPSQLDQKALASPEISDLLLNLSSEINKPTYKWSPT